MGKLLSTSQPVHAVLADVAAGDAGADDGPEAARRWLHVLRSTALGLYDEHVAALLAERLDAGFAERATGAYGRLAGALSNRSKLTHQMGVPQPAADNPPGKKRESREGAAA